MRQDETTTTTGATTTTTTGTTVTAVTDVGSVAVPVTDQDRALRFYVERLGFDVRLDVPTPAGRWVQVAAPGGRVALSLLRAGDGLEVGVDTGITLATTDAEGDHRSLVASGVDADEVLHWPDAPVMFTFRDQDGNLLKIMERAPQR
jgi:catechol 2,3-dioxygenase-like lactoylglutathione lyase family enzyme